MTRIDLAPPPSLQPARRRVQQLVVVVLGRKDGPTLRPGPLSAGSPEVEFPTA
jgi:hypothetical protein